MYENIGTVYNCKKCSRITSSYPFGCQEEDCPIKKDVKNDIGASINYVVYLYAFIFIFILIFN